MGVCVMEAYLVSRLSRLDVKWANWHKGNTYLYNVQHANPFFELLMVTEGPIYMEINDRKLELKSGETLLLRPWELHQGWKPITEEAGFYWVQFSCDPEIHEFRNWTKIKEPINILQDNDLRTSSNSVAEVDSLLLPYRFQPTNRYEILRLFERLTYEMNHPKGYFRFRSSNLLSQMIELIANDFLEYVKFDSSIPSSFKLYRNLILFLDEGYTNDLSKEYIESELDRKYEYLCQIFKRYSGITIISYVQQLRIQRAKHLLLNSDKSINEISEEVGYQDSFYFSRVFKKLEGESPSHYRHKNSKSI